MPESTLRKACHHVAERVAERALSERRPPVSTLMFEEDEEDELIDATDADPTDDEGPPYRVGGMLSRRRHMTPEQRAKMRARQEAFQEARQRESAEKDDLHLLLVLSTALSALEIKPRS